MSQHNRTRKKLHKLGLHRRQLGFKIDQKEVIGESVVVAMKRQLDRRKAMSQNF